jgi:maltose O-acetyltransferase
LEELFGVGGDTVWMQPPFYCVYGSNILLGERVFLNDEGRCSGRSRRVGV